MPDHETCWRFADFDGTFTAEIGDEYEQFWTRLFSVALDIPFEDLLPKVELARSQVYAHPENYGWEIDGKIVAPATTDRFLVMNCVAPMVVNELRREPNHSFRWDTINMFRLMEDLYQASYGAAQTKFKYGAREFIEMQQRTGKFIIVTNSKKENVSKKLSKLMGVDNGITVIGDSLKFKVAVESQSITMPGLSRPVYWERPYYAAVLQSILQGSHDGVVLGDVAEMDLIPALFIGLRGILIKSPNSPPWEVSYMNAHPKGKTVDSLEEAATFIQSFG